MSKKIEITNSDLVKIEPVTDNQRLSLNHTRKVKINFYMVVLVQVKHL